MRAIREQLEAARLWCREQSRPRSLSQRHALALSLLRTASRVAAGVGTRRCQECRPHWITIDRFLDAADPRAAFLEWADRFSTHLARAHADPLAAGAAAMMRSAPERAWRTGELAAALGVTASRLRRHFRDRFRLSVHEYLHLLRTARAIDVCRPGLKVDAAARELGYRSKKDFYAALARWTSITPAQLRRFGEHERERLKARLEEAIEGATGADTTPADQRRRRPARIIRTASVPPTNAAPPTSATPA